MTRVKDKPSPAASTSSANIKKVTSTVDRFEQPVSHSLTSVSSKRLRNTESASSNFFDEKMGKKSKHSNGEQKENNSIGRYDSGENDGNSLRDEPFSPYSVRSSSRIRFTTPNISKSAPHSQPFLTQPEISGKEQANSETNNKIPCSSTSLQAGFHSPEPHSQVGPTSFLINNFSPEFRRPGLITSTQQSEISSDKKKQTSSKVHNSKSTKEKLKRFIFDENNEKVINKVTTSVDSSAIHGVSAISKIIGASGLEDITDQDLELD